MAENYNLKVEDQLILNCSLTHPSNENIEKIKQLTACDLDWDYLVKIAHFHRISPLLYWNLNKISPEAIPQNLKSELQEYFNKNVLRNLVMFKELLNIIDLAKKLEITPIPYKGPVLAIMTYKNLGFRVFVDLDFFVPLKDVPKISEILIDEGYEPWMELTRSQEKVFYNYQREFHFTNKKTDVTLEIKWKFLSIPLSVRDEPFFDEIDFLKDFKLDQFKVKTVSPEYLILILSIHNAGHSFSRLYRFCDISELIKSEDCINWQKLMEISNKLGVDRIFMVNLYTLRELFRIPLPEEILEMINNKKVEKISGDILKRLFTPKPMGLLEHITFHMKLRENKAEKLKTMLDMVFLPTPGVIDSVSLPSVFRPIYYILRVFQMLKNIIINR